MRRGGSWKRSCRLCRLPRRAARRTEGERMLQVTLEAPGRFIPGDVPSPTTQEGEALVRIRRIGICGTDLHAFRGEQPFFDYPRVLGHELAGEIVAIGPNDRGL